MPQPHSQELDRPITDPLAATLLPVLMHRMNNTTQLLSTLNTLSARGEEVNWLEERSGDLAHASESIDHTGYLLAILACACGADLLLERRVSGGLGIAVRAVGQALKREHRFLAEPERVMPLLAPDVRNGWELPWALASLLLQAGRSLEAEKTLEWQLLQEDSSWVLVSDAPPADRFESLASAIARRLPECTLDVRRHGWSWRMPAPWLSK